MGTIRVHTANERIVFDNKPIITSGNKNINDISVTFCDKWLSLGENTEYWAVFYKDEKEKIKMKLKNGSCLIPNEMLKVKGFFYFGVAAIVENEDKVKTSKNVEYEVIQGADITEETGESEIDIAVNSAKEEYRANLENSLETATGENHDNKTWEELNSTVAELPIISEEQTQALGDWDLIKQYFENYRNSAHHIFTQAPKDVDGNNLDYRLPYFYTPNAKWSANAVSLSTNLLEVGLDVSSAVNLGGGNTVRTFSPLPKLEKLVLTGNANNPSLYNFMTTNYQLKYIKMETPNETVLNSNPSYYKRAFYSCERLVTIDCELDFTGQKDTLNMFANAFLLKGLRIKPFTLRCSLDVRACRYFTHPEIIDSSLLSILNAIPNPETEGENEGITIAYSNYGWIFETESLEGSIPVDFVSRTIYFNPETGLYSWEKQTENSRETDLYDAFVIDKGVTLAT